MDYDLNTDLHTAFGTTYLAYMASAIMYFQLFMMNVTLIISTTISISSHWFIMKMLHV